MAAATRTIPITPTTRYVNVAGGEIVGFVEAGKSFAWHFDGPVGGYRFNLAQVAPPGMINHPILAYVDVDPRFVGGR